jgi:hypothetical protein
MLPVMGRRPGVEPSVDPDHLTVRGWLLIWLDEVVGRAGRPNMYTPCAETVRRHIVPILGRERLTALRRKDVNDWSRNRERTKLAPRTIHRLWAVLQSALE